MTRDELIAQLKTLLPEGVTAVEVRSVNVSFLRRRFSGDRCRRVAVRGRGAAAADCRRAAALGGAAAAARSEHATARLVAIGIVLIAIAVYLRDQLIWAMTLEVGM